MKVRKIKDIIRFSVIGFNIIALVFLLNACNDKPTDIGYSLIQDTVNTKTLTSIDSAFIISHSNSFIIRDTLFNKGALFVGKSENMKAVSMLRFAFIPDSLSYVTSADIDSVSLILPVNKYVYGDTVNKSSMSFRVYKIKQDWSNKTTWDIVYPGGSQSSSYFDETKTLASFNAPIIDTIPVISIPLDKELLVDWFQLAKDTVSRKSIYGIALVPDESSTSIRSLAAISYSSSASHPTIKVYFKNKSNARDSAILGSGIDYYIVNNTLPNDSSMTVQGAVYIRSKIDIDLSKQYSNDVRLIPDLSAIHSASLELTLDSVNSNVGNSVFDSTLYAILYRDSLNGKSLSTYYASRSKTDKSKYTFHNITSAIEHWVKTGIKKGSLVITIEGLNEDRSLNKLKFYGNNEIDKTKRPKLNIIYSTRPKPNNKK